MLIKVSEWFRQIAGLKMFCIAVAIYLVFGAFIMPFGAAHISKLAGKPVQIVDLQMGGYSPTDVRAIISMYTDEARHFSWLFTLIADSLYPFAYTFLYIIIIAWVFKPVAKTHAYYTHVHLFPLIAMGADFCENACIIAMFRTYPNFSDLLVHTSSTLTMFKWITIGIQTALVLWGIILLLLNRRTAKA